MFLRNKNGTNNVYNNTYIKQNLFDVMTLLCIIITILQQCIYRMNMYVYTVQYRDMKTIGIVMCIIVFEFVSLGFSNEEIHDTDSAH